jgi:hypothetical protein
LTQGGARSKNRRCRKNIERHVNKPAQFLYLCVWVSGLGGGIGLGAAGDSTEATRHQLEAKFAEVLREAGPTQYRFGTAGTASGEFAPAKQRQFFQELQRERFEEKWLAALVSEESRIEGRFQTWKGLADYLADHGALVEVWTYSEQGTRNARRLTAAEIAALKKAGQEQPTFVTASFKDADTIKKYRIEWGLRAAEKAAAAEAGYARHRGLQWIVRRALGARDGQGRITPQEQWEAFSKAIQAGRLSIRDWRPRPTGQSNLFVAVEYEVDEYGNGTNVARVYRESEINRFILRDASGRTEETLRLWGNRGVREALAFRVRPGTDTLEPAPSPVLGQDAVELRVRDFDRADPGQWNLVEFGEAELVRQSALAQFSLVNAHLERQRKAIGVKKANLDLIAEPIIAALNIGGGFAGAGFPYGEAARLAYNLITPKYIPDVPTVREMRELFALLAARQRNPEMNKKLAHFLSAEDIRTLEQEAARLSDGEVDEFARNVSDSDLEAMVFLARMRRIDARVTNLLNILTSAAKVSGKADSGVLREIFNNSYVSLNGEWSIKNSLAAILGEELLTPRNSVSLEDLAHGRGPAKAWAQYFDFTVDLRALVNTIGTLPRRNFAEKELYKPLPYALKLSDLAAYEVRIFGFPLLMFYKRGLIKADYQAYQEDYAYGIDGPKILEHFRTREEMDEEIRGGRMVPIGYVKVPDGKGGWKDTNLAVFAHRIRSGRYKGRMVIVIYGLKAYADHSEVIERELKRLQQFEGALEEGGVIEQVIETNKSLRAPELEPRLHVGVGAVEQRYGNVLARLLEEQRERWREPDIRVTPERELVSVDRFYSSFVYRTAEGEAVQLTLIPSLAEVERSLRKSEQAQEIEKARREGLGKSGVVFLNYGIRVNDRYEIGPLLTNTEGQVIGAGVRTSPTEVEEVLAAVEKLPMAERATLEENNYAATLLTLELGGKQQTVFMTVEFPMGTSTERERTNSMTGEREKIIFENGLATNIRTPRRVTEITYDDYGVERESKTYGMDRALIEQSRTLEVLRGGGKDAYAARLVKLRVNFVTGEIKRETYGAFHQPTMIVDDQFVTTNSYGADGGYQSSAVFDNGRNDGEFGRALAAKVLSPVTGPERFTLRVEKMASGRTELKRVDATRRLERTIIIDGFGRKAGELWREPTGAEGDITTRSIIEYRDDFFHGLVPFRTRVAGGNGVLRSEGATEGYDADQRRIRATVTEGTGRVTTNVWDYRWEAPSETYSEARVTTNTYDRTETSVTGFTIGRGSGELLSGFAAQFDVQKKQWEVRQTKLFSPGITGVVETILINGFGRTLATRSSENITTSFRYDENGILTNVTSRSGDVTVRMEDDFRWDRGTRNARVQTFGEGRLADTFRVITDVEGRTIVDGIREFPGLQLRTEIRHEGDTERVIESEELQNGQRRTLRRPQPPVQPTNGGWLLPVEVRPAFGLSSTQFFGIGDALARPASTVFEDGTTARVAEWFSGMARPRVSEVLNANGRRRERVEVVPNYSTNESIPCDLVRRYKQGFFGGDALAEEQAVVRGTDVLLLSQNAGERIHYDFAKPYAAPLFATDPQARNGTTALFNGVTRSNVTRFISVARSNTFSVTEWVDTRGLFYHAVTREVADLAGNPVTEETGRAGNSEAWTNALAGATPAGRTRYIYEKGWLTEQRSTEARMMVFTTNGPGIQINDSGRRDFATQIEISDTNGLLRRVHTPRILETNVYLPGRANVWTAWTASELDRDGHELFQSELIYDAQGRLSATKTSKGGSKTSTKIVYDVGPPSKAELTPRTAGNSAAISLTVSRKDIAGSEFIYWYALCTNGGAITWSVADAQGRTVGVTNGEPNFARHVVAQWPVEGGLTLWLPDAVIPEQAFVVRAPSHLAEANGVVVVSVRDLLRAGLDVKRLASVRGEVRGAGEFGAEVSPVFGLRGNGTLLRSDEEGAFVHGVIRHSTGLKTFITAEQGRSEGEIHGAQRLSAVSVFNDLPVLSTYTVRGKAHVFVVDHSSRSPQPLYAMWPREGRFLEHYKTAQRDGAEVYAIAQGFELSRVEIFDPRALGDEVFPGTIAYGRDYQVIFHPARGRQWLGKTLAALESRVVANTFKFGGEQVFDGLGWTNLGSGFTPQFSFSSLHQADNQAREIRQLPMLADALLPGCQLPWEQESVSGPAFTNNWKAIGFALDRLHLKYPATGLVPTAPETAVERYVDTEKEADLIILGFKIGERALARDVLEFYWQKSHGGQVPLHASYDAQAGTAMTTDLAYKRPLHSRRTAGAQLAIAEAAFTVGLETGEKQWLTLGRNLLDVLLENFRAVKSPAEWPRGIAEHEFLPARRAYGLTLWPEAELFSLRDNARAAILLKRLSQISDRLIDRGWRFQLREALREQEAWLRERAFGHLEQGRSLPKGWFTLQDVNGETRAIAPERWTSAGDWLAMVEAAHELGVPAEQTRRSLEALARVHGVRVGDTWGLDWSIPILREDVVSSDLTATFSRVARQIGHERAADYGLAQLSRMREGQAVAAILTTAPTRRAIQSGQGFAVHPHTNHTRWGPSFGAYKDLHPNAGWKPSNAPARIETIPVSRVWPRQRTDLAVFVLITAGVYVAILGSAVFWWLFRAMRRKEANAFPDPLMPEQVMHLAEERWARRVLGARSPVNAEKTRYSNAPVEPNFLMQLRAIYKLVIEWRRQENGWAEDDRRIVEDGSDDWLNGLDEYACALGLYVRWVIKAGAKDGFHQSEALKESEDSNHIWARLVMFNSEFYWGVLTLVRNYNNLVLKDDKTTLYGQMAQLLNSMGLRQRGEAFDAGALFNYPEDRSAMDLLIVQQPGRSLDQVLVEASQRLRIPYLHLVRIIERYKDFKHREQPYPMHPYLIEFAKIAPHFLLMGLGALVWFNQGLGDSPIVPYLGSVLVELALSPWSLLWAAPLFASLLLGVATHFVRIYRFDAPMLMRERTELVLDATLTSLFVKRHSVMPREKQGRWWNPNLYEWSGWGLRAVGYLGLAVALLSLDTPSFATFLVVKGILAMLALVEVGAIVLPLAATGFSKFLQDWVTRHADSGRFIHFINRLNITATRPASPLWLSIKYHMQPSVPTGDFRGMVQAVVFYFALVAVFFFAGGYLCQQILSLWFMDTYLGASNWKLFFGGLLFWNTMYLLRYGLFVLFTGVASALVTFPLKTIFGLVALVYLVLMLFAGPWQVDLSAYPGPAYSVMFIGLVLMVFEVQIVRWARRLGLFQRGKRAAGVETALNEIKTNKSATLGIVYMSGDDLSFHKLTPDLLMERWTILRDRLGSETIQLLFGVLGKPDDATLRGWFEKLYAIEKQSDVTLWHPSQLYVSGEKQGFAPELGLNMAADSEEQREQLLRAWHVRRWMVSMMSTAGHSQDTAINLVDIGLRLAREGLSAHTVFYLIQNKYDDGGANRPSQGAYDRGELGHRNKLARLLTELAPGARAYNLQNWTPFGFKAGALTGMDLVHEESLRLTTMLLLDRNATVHDLDALMVDLKTALTDPDVVIIIPGRGTTNTLTSVGQGSQMVEEGHRSFLKGLIGLLGGRASEGVGTGWGNILAAYYGRVQRALVDSHSPKMPLTSRMRRGSSFAVRAEGLIGFALHAVGISEDTWAVSQATHNAIALGRRVKFLVSRAIWHKIRETWSHSEWLASFPRWSGGYLQMMHDPLMQRMNDFGALSVFAKEVRANSGRNFLSAPFALLNILFMPLAIMLDITPFIQILVVLWNFGFIMNQILTIHGLNAYLESSGFYRFPALIGAGIAGGLTWLKPGLQPFAPGLIVAGFLVGGFFVGLSRWLYTRVRDILLFGPQLVLHALGQVIRQTLEFTVSGASPRDARGVNVAFRAWAGPREDRPWEGYPHLINLKTVVWVAGIISVVLNLFALANLDMLNVLLLLPSLLFSASALLGPFLLQPRAGKPLGIWTFVPRLLGWATAFVFYTAVSMLIARGVWTKWFGIAIFAAVFGLVLRNGLRFFGYRGRWTRIRAELFEILKDARPEHSDLNSIADAMMQRATDSTQINALLDKLNLGGEQRAAILHFIETRAAPLLRRPVTGPTRRWIGERFASDFSRSLALALFVLIWFFVVPVPGVLVFTAGSYRFSLHLGSIVEFLGWSVTLIIAGAWIGRFIQWVDTTASLRRRVTSALKQLCEGTAPGAAMPADTAHACALMTDIQTYIDQRSLAYARKSLSRAEAILDRIRADGR